MKHLLIVWHSMTGGTEQMAGAAASAAMPEEGVDVHLLHAQDATADDVLRADGFIFATPENLASMSGQMKDFFDRVYYPSLDRVNGRPYAILVCAGSDGTGAVRQIQRIATGLRLREVIAPVIVYTRAQTPERILAPKIIGPHDLALCHETGAALSAGLAAGVF
jgi:multimeric flavodoxin WrbA